MRSVAVLLLFVAAAYAAPQLLRPVLIAPQVRNLNSGRDDSRNAIILRYDSDNIGVDGYSYNVEQSDGQSKQEQGQLINPGTEREALSVRGQFSYVGPDNVVYTVTYIADENGFQPQGAHIPKP